MSKDFEFKDLLAGIAHPTRKPAHPEESASSTGIDSAGSQPATTRNHPQPPLEDARANMRVVRVHAGEEPAIPNTVQDSESADHAGLRVGGGIPAHRATLTTRLLDTGKQPGWKPDTLAGWQDWAATAPPEKLQARVDDTEARLAECQQLAHDADTHGCPMHWLRTPDLPPKGSRVKMQDNGHGCVYKVKLAGIWYAIKFLPPFDGRVSLRDEAGKTWVLPGLDYIPGAVGTERTRQ